MKRIVASIKNQTSSHAGQSEKGEKDNSEIRDHDMNTRDVPSSQEDGHVSDNTQYSSESSDSMQHMKEKGRKVAEPEEPRRRSTRSKTSGNKAS